MSKMVACSGTHQWVQLHILDRRGKMVKNNAYIGHAIGIAIRIMILGLLFAGSANAAELTVCKGCAYSSIQSAIDAASSGDTIQVESGTYYENVNVNKQLTLQGIGMPVVEDTEHSGNAITLSANGIILEGFTVNGGISGIYLSYTSGSTLSNNTIRGSDYGFDLIDSSGNTLSNNIVHGSVAFVGIRLDNSRSNTLIANTVRSDYGIFLINSIDNILTGNIARGGKGAGIGLRSSSKNTLTGNTATASGSGIYLGDSSNNILSGNNVSNNHEFGVYLSGSSSNNKIYNNIFNNINNFLLESSNVATWSITRQSGTNIIGGSYLGGNFWANPDGKGFSQTCKDTGEDGICDAEYTLDRNNIDYLPLTNSASNVNPSKELTGSISGYNINDANGNGVWDESEKGISGWNIRLVMTGKNILKGTSTDAQGFYEFTDLPAGKYVIKEGNLKGWWHTGSTIRYIQLKNGQQSINNNFTNMLSQFIIKPGH